MNTNAKPPPHHGLARGIGHRTASLCQIGHIAVRLGQKLKWNPDAEQFVGNDTANQLLTRAQRAPWQVGP